MGFVDKGKFTKEGRGKGRKRFKRSGNVLLAFTRDVFFSHVLHTRHIVRRSKSCRTYSEFSKVSYRS